MLSAGRAFLSGSSKRAGNRRTPGHPATVVDHDRLWWSRRVPPPVPPGCALAFPGVETFPAPIKFAPAPRALHPRMPPCPFTAPRVLAPATGRILQADWRLALFIRLYSGRQGQTTNKTVGLIRQPTACLGKLRFGIGVERVNAHVPSQGVAVLVLPFAAVGLAVFAIEHAVQVIMVCQTAKFSALFQPLDAAAAGNAGDAPRRVRGCDALPSSPLTNACCGLCSRSP